jgi:hypothetical protein
MGMPERVLAPLPLLGTRSSTRHRRRLAAPQGLVARAAAVGIGEHRRRQILQATGRAVVGGAAEAASAGGFAQEAVPSSSPWSGDAQPDATADYGNDASADWGDEEI